MPLTGFTNVERTFLQEEFLWDDKTNIPYIVVDNFPLLGFLTAFRFLEWISENPEGVISLPTGKTPEYFILWTAYLLKNSLRL